LKGIKEYGLLQRQCNKKAVELGFLKEWGKEAGRFSGSAKETETQDVVRRHLSLSLTTMRPFLLWKFKWFGMGTIDVWGK
jgi:hypothetical protein